MQKNTERAIVLSDKTVLEADDIPLERKSTFSMEGDRRNSGNKSMDEIGVTYNLEELERKAIARAVSASNGNLTRAAELLGITRFALYRKIEKLGI